MTIATMNTAYELFNLYLIPGSAERLRRPANIPVETWNRRIGVLNENRKMFYLSSAVTAVFASLGALCMLEQERWTPYTLIDCAKTTIIYGCANGYLFYGLVRSAITLEVE